jgi:hypothetical protein
MTSRRVPTNEKRARDLYLGTNGDPELPPAATFSWYGQPVAASGPSNGAVRWLIRHLCLDKLSFMDFTVSTWALTRRPADRGPLSSCHQTRCPGQHSVAS